MPGPRQDRGENLAKQRLAVGVSRDASYLAQVLDQLGIPMSPLESLKDGIASGARVFLGDYSDITSPKPASQERIAIITDHASLGSTTLGKHEPLTKSYYFQLPEKSPFTARSFYANLPVFRTEGESIGVCYDNDNNEIQNSGITISESRNRLIVSLPWDICDFEQGVDWEHRPYFSPSARKHFVEVGPMLDTGAFRRLLLEILLYCFNWVGLPLVTVSPLYKNKRYFSFRIDADNFSQSSTEAGLRIAEKSGLRFTWFLDMARWKNKNEWIMRLLEHNQDVQLHCFRHMTYTSQEVNDINIRKGLKVIRKSGTAPNAIVSPLGYNYRGFSEAIKEHGFAFSSEFGYAVDDLPSHPWGNEDYPLQIPVHPACSGVLGPAGFSQRKQFAHLFDVVARRCDADGICILYDHPIGGLESLEMQYLDLFERLRKSDYEYICMSDYYRAWSRRPNAPTIVFDRGRISVDGFQENGFRLEQVANGLSKPVRWQRATLPQVSLPAEPEEFCYPPEWIRTRAGEMGSLRLQQREFSKSAWHLNEAYLAVGGKSGYFWCRRLLGRVKWLRALRDNLRSRKKHFIAKHGS